MMNKYRYREHISSLYYSLLFLTLSGNKYEIVRLLSFHNDLALDVIHIGLLCSTYCITHFACINLESIFIEKFLLAMFRGSRIFLRSSKNESRYAEIVRNETLKIN